MKNLIALTAALFFIAPFTMTGASADEPQTVEVMTFKAQEGVTSKQVEDAWEPLSRRMRQQPGFVARSTATNQEETWMVITFWNSRKQLDQANSAVMMWPEFTPLIDVIDFATADFKRLEMVSSEH